MILINWWTHIGNLGFGFLFFVFFFFFFLENRFEFVSFRIDVGLFFSLGGLAMLFIFFF